MKSLSINNPAAEEEKPPVHKFYLSFFSEEQNRSFDRYHAERSLPIIRGSLLLAIGLYISFVWLDPMIIPGGNFEFMSLRIISCLLFFTAIGLTYTRWGVNHFQILMNILVLVAGTALIRMVMVAESAGGYSYYAGLILAIMYAHTLLRIRFIYATLTTWFLILMYALITIAYGNTPFEVLMSNLFFLVSANMMGMFASYWLEYYMKAEYWKEQLLHEKTKELQKEHIALKGMPLGTSVLYPYKQTTTCVNPGDIVMLMTDGLAEAFDNDRRLFGYKRIEQILSEMVNSTPEQIIDRFYTESENWIGEKPQSDDMTFFIFKRNVVDQTKNLKLFPTFSFPSADIN